MKKVSLVVLRRFHPGILIVSLSFTLCASAPPAAAQSRPTATLTAAPPSIERGRTATLSWHTTDATKVSLSPGVSVALSGIRSVHPRSTTIYILSAVGPGGTATASATVTVSSPAARPATTKPVATPSASAPAIPTLKPHHP